MSSPFDPAVPTTTVSEFRIEKARADATLTLSNGTSVRGCVFVGAGSATHAGPERVRDVINGESRFFAFEVNDARGRRTVLYNRDHVVLVTLGAPDEPQTDPGYDVATQRAVSMLLTNGVRLAGTVRVYTRQGHDRLSDYARTFGAFEYLEAGHATFLVNAQHVVELSETHGS